MVYGIKWESHRAEDCIKGAEERALRAGQTWGMGFLYRFEDHTYAQRIDPFDDFDDNWTSVTYLELNAYNIRSKTPCGYTIYADNSVGWRFINMNATKKFALPTVNEALESYIARKKRQFEIYDARAKKAFMLMEKARKAFDERQPPEKMVV